MLINFNDENIWKINGTICHLDLAAAKINLGLQ